MNEEINIIVCIKQVPDPEGPPSAFQVDSKEMWVIPKGIPPVLSPFDENALESALHIKDTNKNVRITAISMGKKLARAVVIKALAVGADEIILLEDKNFDPKRLDCYSVAYVLATAIKKIGKYDLILLGRQAADWNFGQVGSGIAEIFEIPSITLAQNVKLEDGNVMVERVLPDGYEVIRVSMPVLITVSHEVGDLRYPSMHDIKKSKNKPITTWNIRDLGIELPQGHINLLKLFVPKQEKTCHFVEGESLEEAGANLALKLKEDKII
ncbi:MAG TPA: electron transfer flavoprotein subunit beta/FixA family protein [Thermoplasmata archaeon]|uniref:Electron transfer flavoprotein beta subunit/FixA family protein n=1 Tax=Candidatus Methanolliviera hydrocarbonicum TaxID=2491085 RepID=A0A520KVT5_9EURY|nr:MAG: electron transfer flavoprotein beta subunit/FixA family protein [Candidatus Methanolliviera hydrocarbonicum]HIH98428.1 electron transfer flavoprotein subunit beta/FixA family protein [Thermoplasmata archaeon]